MSWEKYSVMDEFLKIAKERDLLGLEKTAAPASNPYEEDKKTIEEKRLPAPEKSIIEEAHPEPVFVAESLGEGGLVENQLEQHEKLMGIINKMPTGSLVGRHAANFNVLVKVANACDQMGEVEASDLLTKAAEDILGKIESFF